MTERQVNIFPTETKGIPAISPDELRAGELVGAHASTIIRFAAARLLELGGLNDPGIIRDFSETLQGKALQVDEDRPDRPGAQFEIALSLSATVALFERKSLIDQLSGSGSGSGATPTAVPECITPVTPEPASLLAPPAEAAETRRQSDLEKWLTKIVGNENLDKALAAVQASDDDQKEQLATELVGLSPFKSSKGMLNDRITTQIWLLLKGKSSEDVTDILKDIFKKQKLDLRVVRESSHKVGDVLGTHQRNKALECILEAPNYEPEQALANKTPQGQALWPREK